MRYIDADRLKAEIEKRMHICDGIFERDSDTYYQGKAVAYQETLPLIDSLQQEQQEYIRKDALIEWIQEARAIPHENAITRDLAFQEIVNKLNSM